MSDHDIREVAEGLQYQGEDEIVAYTINTSNWGGGPSSVTAVVKEVSDDYTDVTATVMPTNSPSVSTDTITLSPLKLLTRDKEYRVEVKFTSAGQVLECHFTVMGQR